MGFRWTISLVFLHFVIFLYGVLLLAFNFIIGTCYIVCLLDRFLFVVFSFISSHFLSLGFYLFLGAQEFWVMGTGFYFVFKI